MARNFIVVGDGFEKFAQLDQCISFTELQNKLETTEFLNDLKQGDRYYPGQGICAEPIQTFIDTIEAKGISNYFTHWYSACIHFKAEKKLTHKHNAANTLVTDPQRRDSNTFELEICIDENNEIMSDHTTGFHLQGMLLIEAIRQSGLAVTEKFFLPKGVLCQRSFVFHDFSINFLSSAFPVDAKIIYKITDSDTTNPLKLCFTSRIEIHQGNNVVASANATYSVFKKLTIERMHRSMAEKCLKQHLRGLSNEPQFLEAVNS